MNKNCSISKNGNIPGRDITILLKGISNIVDG
jgi:hypothetical protein